MICKSSTRDDDDGTALVSPLELKKSLINAPEHEADRNFEIFTSAIELADSQPPITNGVEQKAAL